MLNFKKEKRIAFYFLLPALLILLFVHIIPIILSVYISLIDLKLQNFSKFLNVPSIGLQNYIKIFMSKIIIGNDFLYSLRNISIFGIIVIFFTFVIALFVSHFFNQNFRGKSIYIGIILIPYFTMDSVAYNIWRHIFTSENGAVNRFLFALKLIEKPIFWLVGDRAMFTVMIATIWKFWPFFAIVILAGLVTIPKEIYEAAMIDGANSRQRFIKITLPHIWPLLQTLLIISIIWILHTYNSFFVMFGAWGTNSQVIIPSFAIIKQLTLTFNYGIASAMSVILLLLTFSVTLIILFKIKGKSL